MIDKENALQNLHELNEIFTKHNIKYWIQDGTLLGFYRDKNFIKHDNDIDIGISWKDFTHNVMFNILDSGFDLNAVSGLVEDSLVVNIIKRNINIDFYFYYDKDDDEFYHSALVKPPYVDGRYRVDYSYKKFNVKEIEFLNCKCFAPDDILYFIETKYGKHWKTPNTKWVSSVDPLNRVVTNITVKKKRSREDFQRWLNDR